MLKNDYINLLTLSESELNKGQLKEKNGPAYEEQHDDVGNEEHSWKFKKKCINFDNLFRFY